MANNYEHSVATESKPIRSLLLNAHNSAGLLKAKGGVLLSWASSNWRPIKNFSIHPFIIRVYLVTNRQRPSPPYPPPPPSHHQTQSDGGFYVQLPLHRYAVRIAASTATLPQLTTTTTITTTVAITATTTVISITITTTTITSGTWRAMATSLHDGSEVDDLCVCVCEREREREREREGVV